MTFKTRKIKPKKPLTERSVSRGTEKEQSSQRKPLRRTFNNSRSFSAKKTIHSGHKPRKRTDLDSFDKMIEQQVKLTENQSNKSTQIKKDNYKSRSKHGEKQSSFSKSSSKDRSRKKTIQKDSNQISTEKKDNLPALKKGILRVIPLGGCEEVGRNMTVFEYENDIIIIDMGYQFPEEDTPGIDYIIPNIDYLKGKEKKIRAVIFTHGHMDHIGAVPFLNDKLGNPLLVGNKMTLALIKDRQEDRSKGSSKKLKTLLIDSFNRKLKFGNFTVRFFPVSHSIIDALGIILETPAVNIIHPGDWNVQHGKVVGQKTDYAALNKLVRKPNVLMLESLSVNYKSRPVPEEEMYANLEKVISGAPGRVIIGTFSSMVERVKTILGMAEKFGRKVAIDGLSLKKNLEISKKIGYIDYNQANLIDVKEIKNVPDNKLIVICTGAQGEERAALTRITNGDHRFIKFKKEDTVIFSSSIIPGNERSVQKLKDAIYRQSDNVIHTEIMNIHTGGHACAEDVREMIKMINPTYFMPVYANHYMLKEAAKLARQTGYDDKHIFVPDNGSVFEFNRRGVKLLKQTANTDPVFVDGLGISDLQHVVLRDRQILSEDGMVVIVATVRRKDGSLVHNPDIISRGFVYLKENKALIEDARKKIRKIVESHDKSIPLQREYLRNKLRNDLGQFLMTKTGKRPMILPVVIEV